MSHSKKAARLTAMTLAASLLLAAPALAARKTSSDRPEAAGSWIARILGPTVERLFSFVPGPVRNDLPWTPGQEQGALTRESSDRELHRGPYIDPNGGTR